MSAGPDSALTGRQVKEAKLAQAQIRINQLEEAVRNAGGTIPPLEEPDIKPPKLPQIGAPTPPPGPSGPPPPPPPCCPPPPPRGPTAPVTKSVPAADDILTKLGMKSKKKWSVEGNMKKTNWKAIPANKLTGLKLDKIDQCLSFF